MVKQELFSNSASLLVLFVKCMDIVVVGASFMFAHFLYFNHFQLASQYINALILACLLTPIVFTATGCYLSWRGRSFLAQMRVVIFSWLTIPFGLLVLSVALKATAAYSRIWFVLWTFLGAIALIITRQIMVEALKYMRKRGWNHKQAVIYGAGPLGQFVANKVKSSMWTGYHVSAFFDDNEQLRGTTVEGVPVHCGKEENLKDFIVKNNIQEVWLALPLREDKKVRSILFELRHLAIAIRFIPDLNGFSLFLNHGITEIAGITGIELNHSPMADGLNWLIKVIEDRVLALIFLIVFSPIMLAIAIAIKLDSRGPVLFKQERHGWDGIPIRVYKFRTMCVHKEKEGEFTQATKNDARVTSVGAFLRKTSLDELPQLYNVLQGRMSIVGPRPHPVLLNDRCQDQIDCYVQRHRVKPGMTGWAQVNGWRGETDSIDKMKKRVDHDLYYIRNWSLWFDLKIIVLTLFKGFINEKAY